MFFVSGTTLAIFFGCVNVKAVHLPDTVAARLSQSSAVGDSLVYHTSFIHGWVTVVLSVVYTVPGLENKDHFSTTWGVENSY